MYSSGLIQVETLEYSFLMYDIPGHNTTSQLWIDQFS